MRTAVALMVVSVAALAQERVPVPTSGNVTLPLDEYNRLVELATRTPKKPPAAPPPYALQSAGLKLQVTGELLSGTVQLEGEVFADKRPVKVPLVTGMTVLDAQLQGRELPLEQDNGVETAILSGPAPFSIRMEAAVPMIAEAGRASFTLPVPAAGTARLTLVIPGDHTSVNLNPGLITSRTSNNGRTTVEATLAPGRSATIWWATHESAEPPALREVRFLSDVKTLVSVGEAELGLAVLADVTVVQGEPAQFELPIPEGYEVTGTTGSALSSSEVQGGSLILKVEGARGRSFQFLVSLEKSFNGTHISVPFLGLKNTQRETGEVLVEGEGSMELSTKEGGGLKRMDLKETSPYLRGLSRHALQAAFRYHRQPAETPALALEWVRFPASKVLAAAAQQATVTTLVTSEGKSLTEVKLVLRDQAQPFLKVGLPAGATILTAEIDGQKVKPVEGPDGSRVPLFRTGLHPAEGYSASFVFVHAGAPFARKGDAELSLPKMDIPIGLVKWEVFLPEQYKVRDFGGDVIPASALGPLPAEFIEPLPAPSPAPPVSVGRLHLLTGQLGGVVTDPSGAVVAGTHITITPVPGTISRQATTNQAGQWIVSGVLSGRLKITAETPGFQYFVREMFYDADHPRSFDLALQVGAATETVTVNAESSDLPLRAPKPPPPDTTPSTNVVNLQQRIAGVVPIQISVPHAGNSFRFARPLVIDEETKVTFRYRTR